MEDRGADHGGIDVNSRQYIRPSTITKPKTINQNPADPPKKKKKKIFKKKMKNIKSLTDLNPF